MCCDGIPKGLNLKDKSFKISQKARDLTEECLEHLKSNVFYCSNIKKDVCYIKCIKCNKNNKCTIYDNLTEKIDMYDFLLDVEVEKFKE